MSSAPDSILVEPFVYGSVQTAFGTGYHLLVRGASLARSEAETAQLLQPLMALAECSPTEAVDYFYSTASGLAVVARLTPRRDWQGRPGLFASALAARLPHLLQSGAASLLAVNPAQFPFLSPERVREMLAAQPQATGPLLQPATSLPLAPTVARAEDIALLTRQAGALLATSEAPDRSWHLAGPDGERALRLLVQLRPRPERATLECLVGLRAPLPHYGALNCWRAELAEAMTGANAAYDATARPQSPAALALLSRWEKTLNPSLPPTEVFRHDRGDRQWAWIWLAEGDRLQALAPGHPLPVGGATAAARDLAALEQGGGQWAGIVEHWSVAAPHFGAFWLATAPWPALRTGVQKHLTNLPQPFQRLWANPALLADATAGPLVEACLSAEAAGSLPGAATVAACLALPEPARSRWLLATCAHSPATLLAQPALAEAVHRGELPEVARRHGAELVREWLRRNSPRPAFWKGGALLAALEPTHLPLLRSEDDAALAQALPGLLSTPELAARWFEALLAHQLELPQALAVATGRLAADWGGLAVPVRARCAEGVAILAKQGQAEARAALAAAPTVVGSWPWAEAAALLTALGLPPPPRPRGVPPWLWAAVAVGIMGVVAAGWWFWPKAPPSAAPVAPTTPPLIVEPQRPTPSPTRPVAQPPPYPDATAPDVGEQEFAYWQYATGQATPTSNPTQP